MKNRKNKMANVKQCKKYISVNIYIKQCKCKCFPLTLFYAT